MSHPVRLPVIAGAVLGLCAVAEVALRFSGAGLPVALLLAVAGTAPLALARVRPRAGAAIVTAATALTLLSGQRPPAAVLLTQLAVLGVILVGWLRSVRRQARERDASHRAIADTLVEHAARGERARIARELHDVVAHHISMIAVQAETARLTTPGMPAAGARHLTAIGDTAREALTEMRRLLGVLRSDAAPEPVRAPQPGLGQLNELIDSSRESAGTSTRLIVSGPVAPLDPGVELTAYRIVQEALTNVRRHAPGAAVDVELRYADDALRVQIRDNGPGPSCLTDGRLVDGHGLLGMRERAAAVGGWLWAGARPASGFLVAARLPLLGEAAVRDAAVPDVVFRDAAP